VNLYYPNDTIAQSHSVDNIDLWKIANTLWRGKWFLLVCTLFCFSIADLYIRKIAVPLYPATAKIVLNEGQHKKILTNIESVTSKGPITDISINTELEVLRSRKLVGQLVDSLDLTNQAFFNKYLQVPPLLKRIRTMLFSLIDLDYEYPKLTASPQIIRSNVISSVVNAMKFSNSKNTRVINVSVTTTDSNLSVLIANTMVKLYIENQIQMKLDELGIATKFLYDRTSDLKYEFEKLKTELANFSSQSELVNPVVLEGQKIQLRDLRIRISEARALFKKDTNSRIILQSLKKEGNINDLISYAENFRLNNAISQYGNDKITLDNLNRKVNHFMLDIEAEAERKKKQLMALETSEGLLAKQIARQSQELIVFQQLEHETEAARHLYESFFTRLSEMNVQLGLEAADSRVLSPATKREPSGPKRSQTLTISSALGLIMGAVFLLFWELRFTGYRSSNELSENIGQSVLANVPLIPLHDRKSVISYLKNKPNSVVSEAVRNLRTSILMSKSDTVPQVIMFTSSVPKEGKTMLTFALAQNMLGLGKRIILIEADIRRSAYSINIDRKNTVSLIDILVGNKEFKDVNPFLEELGFDILTATKSEINAADLFASQRFSELLIELREHYDHILIDSPPVLAVSDARVIGAKTDANIYIVEWNKTTRAQVEQGLDMLSSIGVVTTGIVLNQIDLDKIRTFGQTNQYGYDSYGSEYYEN